VANHCCRNPCKWPLIPPKTQPGSAVFGWSGDIGILRGEEIRTRPELVITLRTQPDKAVGIACTVLRIILRLEQFPVANCAVVFLPAPFDEMKINGIFGET
jgi:hypothetical protein